MIDTSTKASTFDHILQVRFANSPDILPTEIQERNEAIEEVARVSSDQLDSSMDFLQEQFNQQLLAQRMLASEEQPKTQTDKQAQELYAATLAATGSQSTEQAQELQAANLAATDVQSGEQAAVLAAMDGVSTEEIKKAKAQRNAEITDPEATTGTGSTGSNGEILDPDDTTTNPDDGTTEPEPGFDNGFKAPWEPLDPPPPQFPEGFDVESLFLNGKYDPITVLTQIAMLFSESMKQLVEGRIESQKELSAITSALQQETIENKTAEQLEQLEKSEQAGKAGNCITTLVTVAVTLLSIALAFVTGGAASALLALGITAAFLVIDMSMTAAGETPLSAMMMEPLMTHVIMPVIMELMKFFQGILEDLGASEELARTLSMVFAILVVAVAVVAIIVGVRNSSMLGSLMSKIGEKLSSMLGAITPEFIQTAGTQAMATFSNFATNIMTKVASGTSTKAGQQAFARAMATGASKEAAEEAAETAATKAVELVMTRASNNVRDGMMGTMLAGTIGTSTAGIFKAEYTREVTELQSIMQLISERMLLGSEELTKYAEQLRAAYEKAQSVIDLAFQEAKGQLQSSLAILNNMAIRV